MANYPINPYGQGSEMPTGYPIANDLDTNDARQALSAAMGKRIKETFQQKQSIVVAAADAPSWQKAEADFQCDGVNDELTIQQAVNAIYATKGGILRLSSGTFNIESFPNQQTEDDCTSYAAILIPSSDNTADGYEIRIVGDVMPYSGASSGGTHIRVTDTAYANLDNNKFYRIFTARYVSDIISKAKVSVHFSNFTINLPWNQRKIMCIDCHSMNKVDMRFVTCSGYTSSYSGGWAVGLTTPPAKAVQGCIGVRMVSGANYGCIIDFRNCGMNGFYEGWQVGGEHTVMINCSAIYNVYGYTFGNYAWKHAMSHNITMINCCDEKNVNLPYFANNGYPSGSTYVNHGQAVTMIDYNLERMYNHPEYVPGGVLGDNMKERVPGTFYGEISYAMTDWAKSGSQDYKVVARPLWDTAKINGKCHGQNIKTRNQYQEVATTKSILATYAPNYLQQVWLTDENKMVYCIDTANKTWVDAQGNTVSLS